MDFESHLICLSKASCMKTKVDIECFTLNSVFLIGPKHDDCAEEEDAHGLSLFLSSPLYRASFASSHLGYAHLIEIWLHFQDRVDKKLF